MDTQLHLTADDHVVLEEAVQRVVDRPFGGIFHRHHPVVAGSGLDLPEDIANAAHRHRLGGVTEVLDRRRLGESPRGTQDVYKRQV